MSKFNFLFWEVSAISISLDDVSIRDKEVIFKDEFKGRISQLVLDTL